MQTISRFVVGAIVLALVVSIACRSANAPGSPSPSLHADASAPHIYVVDTGNGRIVQMDYPTGENWTTFGTRGTARGQFTFPLQVCMDNAGRIYVLDVQTSESVARIVRIDDMTGKNRTTFGTYGDGRGQFDTPEGIYVDDTGHIYVADAGNRRIVRFDDMTGKNWTAYGTRGKGKGQFLYPADICVDGAGRIYVADVLNQRLVRIDDMSGKGWITYSTADAGTSEINGLRGVSLDAKGRIYYQDHANKRIVHMGDMTGTNKVVKRLLSPDKKLLKGVTLMFVDKSGRIFITQNRVFDEQGNPVDIDRLLIYKDMADQMPTVLGKHGQGARQFNMIGEYSPAKSAYRGSDSRNFERSEVKEDEGGTAGNPRGAAAVRRRERLRTPGPHDRRPHAGAGDSRTGGRALLHRRAGRAHAVLAEALARSDQ